MSERILQTIGRIRGEAGILDVEFAYRFARIAGFRNFLAHDYEDVDPELICRDVSNRLDEIEHFLERIESKTS